MVAATMTYDANGKEAVRTAASASYSILSATPGLAVTCTSANTDYPTAIPSGAKWVVIWFEDASGSIINGGRVQINASATAIATLTGSDALMGYHPSQPGSYPILTGKTHIHVACATAGAKARGTFYS